MDGAQEPELLTGILGDPYRHCRLTPMLHKSGRMLFKVYFLKVICTPTMELELTALRSRVISSTNGASQASLNNVYSL